MTRPGRAKVFNDAVVTWLIVGFIWYRAHRGALPSPAALAAWALARAAQYTAWRIGQLGLAAEAAYRRHV